MRIISWNINGIGKRYDELEELPYRYRPDFICLQKVRCNDGRDEYKKGIANSSISTIMAVGAALQPTGRFRRMQACFLVSFLRNG